MRRSDRELTDMGQILEIVERENVCTVAFQDDQYPYLIPLNYGARMEDGKLALYFHGAKEGTKLELLKKNPMVSFTIVSGEAIHLNKELACKSSASFESICGRGRAEILDQEKAKEALMILMNHAGRPEGICYGEDSFDDTQAASVTVWRIVAEEVTGKRHE